MIIVGISILRCLDVAAQSSKCRVDRRHKHDKGPVKDARADMATPTPKVTG